MLPQLLLAVSCFGIGTGQEEVSRGKLRTECNELEWDAGLTA